MDYSDLNFDKVFDSVGCAAGIEEHDCEFLKEQLYKVVCFKLLARITGNYSSDQLRELTKKMESGSSGGEKLSILKEFVKDSPEDVGVIEKFFKEELKEVAKKVLDTFLNKATPEEKTKLGNLISPTK